MGVHGKVGGGGGHGPDLDCAIETSGCKGVGVFGVESDCHDVVCVAFVNLDVTPALLPIPSFDGHVVTSGEYDGCGRVDGKTSDIVRVGLESGDLFMGVVIEDAQLKVV